MKRIAIFASGSGTNAQNIIEYFNNIKDIEVSLILSNKQDARVLERAKKFGIGSVVFTKKQLYTSNYVLDILKARQIDFIVLAGFLLLMPSNIVELYKKKMVNIHPALLPGYGGKGMYGMNVHQAVIDDKRKESGITIHYVNECYDEGDIIFQAPCIVEPSDTPVSLAKKIQVLEYKYYPETIRRLLS